MKQLQVILLLLLGFSPLPSHATSGNNTNETTQTEINKNMQDLKHDIQSLRQENGTLRAQITDVRRQSETKFDSLSKRQNELEAQNQTLANKLGIQLKATNNHITQSKEEMNQMLGNRVKIGGMIFTLLLIVLLIIFWILRRRIKESGNTISEVSKAQSKLEEAQQHLKEESIKLDNQLIELLNKKMESKVASGEPEKDLDHSLALKVADEIVRIQTNLSRMDTSIKGYKQLSASVRRIKENFMAQGYEIVDMIGQPYHEGMKVIASFVQDETMKEGEQIITSITKPQVNYNGKMIQAAQITVSQN